MGMKASPADVIVHYCRQRGYPEPVAEYRFDPPRRFAFD